MYSGKARAGGRAKPSVRIWNDVERDWLYTRRGAGRGASNFRTRAFSRGARGLDKSARARRQKYQTQAERLGILVAAQMKVIDERRRARRNSAESGCYCALINFSFGRTRRSFFKAAGRWGEKLARRTGLRNVCGRLCCVNMESGCAFRRCF